MGILDEFSFCFDEHLKKNVKKLISLNFTLKLINGIQYLRKIELNLACWNINLLQKDGETTQDTCNSMG